jgi:hypothetical protein
MPTLIIISGNLLSGFRRYGRLSVFSLEAGGGSWSCPFVELDSRVIDSESLRSTTLLLYVAHVCYHASPKLSALVSASYELSSHATTIRLASPSDNV